jgi:signal transduction histidine kinase
MVGIATVDAGELGRWRLATVVSANRLRAREERARFRLIFGVLTAGGLVAAFGALALRRQRRELELSRRLAVAAVEREHETRLEHANRAATLGTFAMGIAHEISTPAAVIQGRAEQLLARADQASRVLGVVRAFLALARGAANTAESVVPAALVDGALHLVDHRLSKAGVVVERRVPSDLPVVQGDRRLLEHALTNLLLNASDASAPGGRVVVGVRPERERVIFEVLDDGSGISPEHAAHVMEPFFTTKAAGQGTGLGLAIASEIVRAHRGTLELVAREPRGTRAAISLPLSQQELR